MLSEIFNEGLTEIANLMNNKLSLNLQFNTDFKSIESQL